MKRSFGKRDDEWRGGLRNVDYKGETANLPALPVPLRTRIMQTLEELLLRRRLSHLTMI
jgi:hypothetical protein